MRTALTEDQLAAKNAQLEEAVALAERATSAAELSTFLAQLLHEWRAEAEALLSVLDTSCDGAPEGDPRCGRCWPCRVEALRKT